MYHFIITKQPIFHIVYEDFTIEIDNLIIKTLLSHSIK